MISAKVLLEQHNKLDFYGVSSLKQQSMGRHVSLLGHFILIRTNRYMLLLLNAVCLTEKHTLRKQSTPRVNADHT